MEGQSRAPLRRSRVEIARTRQQAASSYDEISGFFGFGGWGDFRDFALVGVFYAGDHPAVRITKLIDGGSNLAVYLAVAPPSGSPSPGAYNVVAVPKRPLDGVRTIEVLGVEEKPLASIPYAYDLKEPDVTIRVHARPRAGRVFKAVVARFAHPSSFIVTHVDCRGSVGGHVDRSGEFAVLSGARLLRPIIRRDRTSEGFVNVITCSWRLPKNAAGKQLVLGENNCYDDCPTGFILDYAVVGGDQLRGGAGNSWAGRSWTIAR
jgi:hypothetical protein